MKGCECDAFHIFHSMYVCEAGCCKCVINWSLSVRPWSAFVRVRMCVRLLRLVKTRVSVVYVEAIVCTNVIPKSMHPTSIAVSCLICYNKNICTIYINWSFFYRWARICKCWSNIHLEALKLNSQNILFHSIGRRVSVKWLANIYQKKIWTNLCVRTNKCQF